MEKKTTKTKKSTKQTTKKVIKITDSEKQSFPYNMFPVKIIHMDGRDMLDKKTCYFQSQAHAQKYVDRCKFKKTDYQIFVNPNGKEIS